MSEGRGARLRLAVDAREELVASRAAQCEARAVAEDERLVAAELRNHLAHPPDVDDGRAVRAHELVRVESAAEHAQAFAHGVSPLPRVEQRAVAVGLYPIYLAD